MTSAEAAEALHMSKRGAIAMLRREGVPESQTHNPQGSDHSLLLFDRETVEDMGRDRARVRWMKAQGYRRCSKCKRWRAEELFYKNYYYCKECYAAGKRSPYVEKGVSPPTMKKQERPQRWGDMGRKVEAYGVRIQDVFAPTRPARAADSEKYACMGPGFSHKGIPHGQTKRQAFCSRCTAERCVHHPEMRPEQVMKMPAIPTLYPEHRIQDYAEAG